ncbi:tyrosine-type recombinase/integrase [Ferrimonas balearica]|uniref:tyrosine-type recombinase/integrase n=1 Tax=Ferrimonas balearica TaxID=44012 RepID=UPI001F27DEBC|nr:site-specific integrase [Ferrimonas balearica]MBY6096168.1 tyrosine-type recombinase/integrase [Ferrimonas balearica]
MAVLTQKQLDSLKSRATDFNVPCGRVPGLCLRVRSTGGMSWVFRYRQVMNDTVKQARVTIGKYDQLNPLAGITLKRAREIASEYRSLMEEGIDPLHEMRRRETEAKTQGRTLHDVFLDFERVKLSKRLRPEQAKSAYERDILPNLGSVALIELSSDAVLALFADMKWDDGRLKRGKINAAYQVLRQVLDHALALGWLKDDPIPRLKLKDLGGGYGVTKRNLSFEELRKVLKSLESWRTDPQNIRLFRFLLGSGQRVSAVLEMRWTEIDLDNGMWLIPASSSERHSKSLENRQLPLSRYLIDILEVQKRELPAGRTLVWPMRLDDRVQQPAAVRSMIRRNAVAGVELYSPHDLRRTFISRCNELRLDPIHIEKAAGHQLSGMLKVYVQHNFMNEQRDVLNIWGDKLYELESNNIVCIYSEKHMA